MIEKNPIQIPWNSKPMLLHSQVRIYIFRTLEIIDTYIHNRIRIELRFLKFLNFLTSSYVRLDKAHVKLLCSDYQYILSCLDHSSENYNSILTPPPLLSFVFPFSSSAEHCWRNIWNHRDLIHHTFTPLNIIQILNITCHPFLPPF